VVEWCKGCSGVEVIESAREDSVVMGVVSVVEIVSMVRSCSCPLLVMELWQYSELVSGGRRSWPLSLY
jgi:hypothetical protein